MSDYIEFGLHDLPWHPAHSELVNVLRFYDGPQAGVIAQHGCLYVFNALLDLPSGAGLWFYAQASEAEVNKLIEIEDPIGSDALLHDLIDDRSGLLALVLNGVVADVAECAGATWDHAVKVVPILVDRIRAQWAAYDDLDQVAFAGR